MNSKTRDTLVTEGFKDQRPFRFPDIYVSGMLPERLGFACEILPFTYHQGTTNECIDIINKNNKKEPLPSSSPLIVCSTDRHIGQNSYSDYHKIWVELKHIYADRLNPT
jgi:exonuclease I